MREELKGKKGEGRKEKEGSEGGIDRGSKGEGRRREQGEETTKATGFHNKSVRRREPFNLRFWKF